MTDAAIPAPATGGEGAAGIPEPGYERTRYVDSLIERSRAARGAGDRDRAADLVVDGLRAGLWRQRRLWSELLSLMDKPADYHELRSLWWESPARCHGSIPILRTVARAASAAGEHDEARLLLRKAILLQARRAQRLRSRLGRLKRAVLGRVASRLRPSLAPFEQRAAVALTALDEELGALGVRSFLISGTLLGFLRDSAFISWDKDIDVGVFTSEQRPAELERAFTRSSRFEVRRLDFNSDRLRVNHANGMMIDIFPHYQGEDGRIWHDGTATRWWNSPFELTTMEFLGRTQFVPDPPERYLDENYGDWRTPNQDFDARLDTPNVEVTDPDYLQTLLYFSLLDAIAQRKPRRRERYLRLLRERGEGDWLDRC